MGTTQYGSLILQKNELMTLTLNKDGYYEGQLVSGTINLEVESEFIIKEINIYIEMLQSFRIEESSNKFLNNYFNAKIFSKKINISKIFKSQNYQNINVKKGIYSIPFDIFLPEKIPPSFEYPVKNKKAFIRYIIASELISENKNFLTEKYLIIRQRPFNIPSPIKYQDIKAIKSNGIFNKGESGININMPTNDLIINNPIKFSVEIDNTKSESDVKEINVKLFKLITCIKNNESNTDNVLIIEKTYSIICRKGEKNNFNFDDIILRDELKKMDFIDKLNPYRDNIYDLNLLMPSLESKIIKCEYKLQVSLEYSDNVLEKYKPSVIIPIYAVHQTTMEFEGDKILIEEQKKNIPKDMFYNGNRLNPYSPENNFGRINNNKYISGQASPIDGICNQNCDFPTLEEINKNQNN